MIGYLIDGLIGGTALALVAALACRFAAVRARPSLVFAIWLVVIARFAVPGLVPIEVPAHATAVFGAEPEAAAAIAPELSAAAPGFDWQGWALAAWLAGASVAGLLALLGWLRVRRTIAAASPLRSLAGGVELRAHPSHGPFAAGVFRPVVVVPAWLAEPELDHVLAHELAHHERRDPLIAALVRVVRVAFFFWPVMWYAARQLAAARERATDQRALGRCAGDRRGYARSLVRVTLAARTRAAIGHAAAMAARPSQLRDRIDDILGGARAGLGKLGAVAVAALVVLALPATRLASADPSPEAIDCTITPGVGERILASHPDADRDGDGTLSRDEICAHQRRMQRLLRDAAVRADVLVDSEHYWFSPAAVTTIAGVAAIDVEIADAGGAVCTPAANRCVEEMVLIDVSAE